MKFFKRTRGAERADAQRASGVKRAPGKKIGGEVIQIRQIGAGPRVGRLNPLAELLAIAREMEVVGGRLHFHGLANQPHAVGIGLQETDVRMAIHGEARGGVREHQRLNVGRRNPGGGNDNVGGGIALQTSGEIFRVHNGPDVGDDARAPQDLAGIQCRHAEPDVADVLVGGEILIGQDETLHQLT